MNNNIDHKLWGVPEVVIGVNKPFDQGGNWTYRSMRDTSSSFCGPSDSIQTVNNRKISFVSSNPTIDFKIDK